MSITVLACTSISVTQTFYKRSILTSGLGFTSFNVFPSVPLLFLLECQAACAPLTRASPFTASVLKKCLRHRNVHFGVKCLCIHLCVMSRLVPRPSHHRVLLKCLTLYFFDVLGSFFTSASDFTLPRVSSCVLTSPSPTVEPSASSSASDYTSARVSEVSWHSPLLACEPAYRPVILTLLSILPSVVYSPSCSVLTIASTKALHYLLCCLVSWAVERVHQGLGMHMPQCVTRCVGLYF